MVQVGAHGLIERLLCGAECLDRCNLACSCWRSTYQVRDQMLLSLSLLLCCRQIFLVPDVNLIRGIKLTRLNSLLDRSISDEAAFARNTRRVHRRSLVERLEVLDEATVFSLHLRNGSLKRLRFQALMAQLLLSSRKCATLLIDHDVRVVLVACGAHDLVVLHAAELVHG